MNRSGLLLSDIAAHIGAQLVGGLPQQRVSRLASLRSAGRDDLSFVVSAKHFPSALESHASALIAPPDFVGTDNVKRALLLHDLPYLAYAKASALFAPLLRTGVGIHPTAIIGSGVKLGNNCEIGAGAVLADDVQIGENSYIGAGCYLGTGTQIGANCWLYANVTIYHEVVIGNRVAIHSGTVIGSDGFGFAPGPEGWEKIYQLGTVRIADDCDIGANVSIARGALDDTLIGRGVIIDDLVLIAHNLEIGEQTAIAGQSGFAGSSKIGARCTFGGQAAVAGHIEIADAVHITGRGVVTRSISKAGRYSSTFPAIPDKDWARIVARVRNIEEMAQQLRELKKNRTRARS